MYNMGFATMLAEE